MSSRFALLLLVLLSAASPAFGADAPTLSGRIVDSSSLPLPGVQVTATPQPAGEPLAATTDTEGRYALPLREGNYILVAELQGFERIEKPVTVGGAPVVLDLVMRIAALAAEVSVVASPVDEHPLMGEARAGAPATVTREVIESAMLPNNTVDDLLPLVPNVVRGPDGLISVAGARAPQGQLLVNSLSQNDPVLGEPDLMLPLDPVDSVQVMTHGYPTEYGRATGGVTLIHMRPGTDTFRFSANSFDPRLHFENGWIHGIEAWEPNVGISGPIAKGRAWFAQGLDYRFVRNWFDTVAGEQATRYDAFLSWSSINWSVTPSRIATFSLSADPQRTDHANINAFTPASTLPALKRGGWRASAVDRLVVGENGTLETGLQVSDLVTRITPDGSAPYVMAHASMRGNYFDAQDRDATRIELTETLTRQVGEAHQLKAGGTLSYIGFNGSTGDGLVEQVRSDDSLVRTIALGASPRVSVSGYEVALFAQDSWTMAPDVTLDAGIRYDDATVARARVVSPRMAVTWKVDPLTTISGGAGVFADKVLLAELAFDRRAPRTITEYGARGVPVGSPVVYANVVNGQLRMPWAGAWHVELDRRFAGGMAARVVYQERSGRNEPVIDVTPGALVLSSRGRSQARSLETTVGYRSKTAGHSLFVSYVRSSATGDLNDFATLEGNFREPFVQADQVGPLPADVPHRLLVWSLVNLPSRITIAPFVEWRNGFPYSPIDDTWRYAGARNAQRLPAFASVDLFVNKIVKLPGNLPLARVGLKLYNITGANNARDIQRDITRPDYGAAYNPIPFELRGVFELMWGRK